MAIEYAVFQMARRPHEFLSVLYNTNRDVNNIGYTRAQPQHQPINTPDAMPGRKQRCVMLPCLSPDILTQNWGRGSERFAYKYRLTIPTNLTTLLTCLSSISKHVSISPPSPAILATTQRNTASSKMEKKLCYCSSSLCQSGPGVISLASGSPFRRWWRMSNICPGSSFAATQVADRGSHMCADSRDTRGRPKIAVVPSGCSNS